jgi:hypothetical protein
MNANKTYFWLIGKVSKVGTVSSDIAVSIEGVTSEINRRTSNINTLVACVVGSESRFIKPVKRALPDIERALKLHREVKKLKVIRKELQLIQLSNEIKEMI